MRKILVATFLGAAILCAPAVAQEKLSTGADNFTFKRVKVGKKSKSAKRILVQIDPAEQARVLAAVPPKPDKPEKATDKAAKPAAPAKTDAAYAWFWELISPAMHDSGPGRLSTAVTALTNGPSGQKVLAPRLTQMQKLSQAHGTEILKATIGTQVSPALVLAVIGIESAGKTDAVSHAGATGLMQLMPATAKRFGVTDRTDAAQNIKGGVAYLNWLMKEFDGDPVLVLAAYNAGEGAVKENGGVPPYRETRDYVPKVLAAWTVARTLCMTPPQLASDGCVFSRTVAQAGN